MGSVIENAKTKEKCQIFTPDDIVETMLDHVGYIDSLYGKTILEKFMWEWSISKRNC